MDETQKAEVSLYRMEYLDEGTRIVDWIWLTSTELEAYLDDMAQVAGLIYRQASSEEEELYDEAYNNGYDVATMQEVMSHSNGVSFRLNLESGIEFKTTKVFECGICGEYKDFDDNVAMANGFYISVNKETEDRTSSNILWHICYECAMLELSVE